MCKVEVSVSFLTEFVIQNGLNLNEISNMFNNIETTSNWGGEQIDIILDICFVSA